MKKVILVYFSPTGNTRKSLEAMAGPFGGATDVVDLTVEEAPVRTFDADDVVIMGPSTADAFLPWPANVLQDLRERERAALRW